MKPFQGRRWSRRDSFPSMVATHDAPTKVGAYESGSLERSGRSFHTAGRDLGLDMCQRWGEDEDEDKDEI
jgi:hypothetical protein